MDKIIIESLKEILSRTKALDYFQLAENVYPNHDLVTVQVEQGYNAKEAINLLLRALDQLEVELNSENARFLPNKIAVPDVNNNDHWDVHMCLSNIVTHVPQPENFRQIGVYLQWLITYEIFCGFWDRSEKKVHSVDEIKLKEQQKDLAALSKKLSEILKSAEELSLSHAANIKQLEELIRTKNEEFNSLSNMVGKANNEASQITQLWEQATRQKGEFDNLINQASESIKNVNAQIEAQKSDFGTLKSSIQNSENELLNTAQTANDTLTVVLNSKEQISQRMKEAAELLGMSADAALGGKFNKRENDVHKSLIYWRWAVGISVVVAVGWAVIVFLCLATKTELPYLDILVNLVKTSPGFVLMGYIMAQYNKERAIEEEYAFKAAIAMTINAYANLLQENDSDPKKAREIMLLDAIKQVYAKPEMHKEKVAGKDYKKNTDILVEVINALKGKAE